MLLSLAAENDFEFIAVFRRVVALDFQDFRNGGPPLAALDRFQLETLYERE